MIQQESRQIKMIQTLAYLFKYRRLEGVLVFTCPLGEIGGRGL